MACSLGFYGDGISFRVVFSQSFWLRVLPGGALLVQPRWMQERRILGSGRTCGISFWTFLNSSGWWWLINSVLLTRTSCGKITHTNDYYGAWPGWAVSVSVLPLTLLSSSLMLEISHLDSHSITLPFFASLKSHSLHFLGWGSTWRLVSHLHFSTKRYDISFQKVLVEEGQNRGKRHLKG